jgi:ADP-dependent NAD(P)H-hydrate dehydratase / NAD(P)H-hydrate epimerase
VILSPLPDAAQMRETDRWAIEERGIPSLELMEAAGAGLADLVTELAPAGTVAILCGGGNNGGDGLVAARLLRDAGREVRVALTTDPGRLQGDARANLDRLPGDPPAPFDPAVLDGAAVAVDALLGTGFSGAPREPVRGAIGALNDAGIPVVACDVPSGVDASTGEVADVAVHATATATFHQAKPGLWIAPGKAHAGRVRTVAIGIPDGAPVAPQAGLIGPAATEGIPGRDAASTKFTSGHVLVAGGSTGLTGAPCLAAEAAMRAGAGYVACAVPASLNPIFEQRLLEVMTIPLPDAAGHLTADGAGRVLDEAGRRGGALVVGPGLGRDEAALALARDLAARAPVPLVLDADGLNAHAGRLEELAGREQGAVLTPHGGELARLLDVEGDAIRARRLHHAREAARRARAVVVLKGDDTIVADPGGRAGVSPGGAPALATAGTGDVLAGVIGALLAKGLEPFAAACAGVRLHLDAGRRAAVDRHADSVLARDVIDALGR